MTARVVSLIIAALLLVGCSATTTPSASRDATTTAVASRDATASVSSGLVEYVDDLIDIMGSVSAIRTDLVTAENYLDPGTVMALAAESQEFGDAFEAAMALNPPAEAEELHETVLEALVTCEEALLWAAQYMNGDGEHYLNESTESFRRCGDLFGEATDLLEEVQA